MNPRAVVLFDALLSGMRVKIGEYTYLFDEAYNLCVVGLNVTEQEEVLLKVDSSLQHLIALAGAMRDNEYDRLVVNIGLNQAK